ncbi:MAG: tRNA (adenosine(37)-N6)-dimethylallyltransferase MiaA [Planctomycetaceae bacterium]|nr:tRNA (adenosine(37)-N6)-dimethylallyltransferase MiaA [Planctomycetaceae bacterium]
MTIKSTPPATDCWYVTGPTASGKTEIGLQLAQRLDAEVISLDSMAVYQQMDIGTAKPTTQQRQVVPHHLLDVVSAEMDFSLSQYVNEAHLAIDRIRQAGRQVLFVGGTPLYLKSLLRGIYEGPPADWEFREQIEKELEAAGVESLHQRLAQVDPLTAHRLHPHDKRRIIRALEVHKITGQPISHQQEQFDEGQPAEKCRVFVLGWPRPVLHSRIEKRVEAMFAAGLVEEVEKLLEQYQSLSRTASQAVGYREVIEMLQQGTSLEATIERVTIRTRQFARRQETWFRSLSECRRIERAGIDDPMEIVDKMLTLAESVEPGSAG